MRIIKINVIGIKHFFGNDMLDLQPLTRALRVLPLVEKCRSARDSRTKNRLIYCDWAIFCLPFSASLKNFHQFRFILPVPHLPGGDRLVIIIAVNASRQAHQAK